jgi:redox-sensitive bicupin YhaK (pirin superfamily)
MTPRTIKAQHPAIRDDVGDLVTRRPLPGPSLKHLDPFLFLNHHGPQTYPPGNHGLPFGPHPHRGFETVTFILEGELTHRDSSGHESIIGPGGVQWMTAGRGIVHSELSPESFMRSGGRLEILQLWVNLPARLKMTKPRYVGLQKEDIPTYGTGKGRATITVIAGLWEGHKGPIETLTDMFMSVVEMAPGALVHLPAAKDRNVFLYVARGEVQIGGEDLRPMTLVEFNGDGDVLDITAKTDAVLLFGHAPPFNEPIVAHGPFVMNTRDEIIQAIRDYQAGKFAELPGQVS